MQQSRNYKRDSQSECKQALEIWPESGGSRVSGYRDAVALVQAQDAINASWDTARGASGAVPASQGSAAITDTGKHCRYR